MKNNIKKSTQEKKDEIKNLFREFVVEINEIKKRQSVIKQDINQRKTQKEIDKIRKNLHQSY